MKLTFFLTANYPTAKCPLAKNPCAFNWEWSLESIYFDSVFLTPDLQCPFGYRFGCTRKKNDMDKKIVWEKPSCVRRMWLKQKDEKEIHTKE